MKFLILPGGRKPEQKTAGAACYDVYPRAIVSNKEMEEKITGKPHLRKTLFDFEKIPDRNNNPNFADRIFRSKEGLEYCLRPGESVLIAIGFLTEMDLSLSFKVLPRSGFSTNDGIVIRNSLSPVDSDYRGEAGAMIWNTSDKNFFIHKGMRIAQIEFVKCVVPEMIQVGSFMELSQTGRGAGGFGSTGV